MLSYQHGYHAGNLADVHKHSLLATALAYMTMKDKPLSYLETHAGRGVYDLSSDASLKTGEAAVGIGQVGNWFTPDHPYRKCLDQIRDGYGTDAYPGSPMIAALCLRDGDAMQLAELHPQEHEALEDAMNGFPARIRREDGLQMALSATPPDPRRGMMVIDPSYEIKTDYDALPGLIRAVHRKWNVGVIMLWYPILTSGAHLPMLRDLEAMELAKPMRHEVHFPPARDGHGMIGSGLFFVNTPFGIEAEAARLQGLFKALR